VVGRKRAGSCLRRALERTTLGDAWRFLVPLRLERPRLVGRLLAGPLSLGPTEFCRVSAKVPETRQGQYT